MVREKERVKKERWREREREAGLCDRGDYGSGCKLLHSTPHEPAVHLYSRYRWQQRGVINDPPGYSL